MEGNPAVSAAISNELKMLLEEGELCQEVGGPGVSKSSKNGVFYKSSYLRFDFFISMQN